MSERTRPAGPLLRINGPVRRALGVLSAAALSAGVDLPPDAQCYGCGHTVDLAAGAPPAVLSVVELAAGYVATYAHPGCATSRVFTPREFSATLAGRAGALRVSVAAHRFPG